MTDTSYIIRSPYFADTKKEMMITDARKLTLIKKILKVRDNHVLTALEDILSSAKPGQPKASIYDFVGIISKDDAAEMRAIIAATCETINNA